MAKIRGVVVEGDRQLATRGFRFCSVPIRSSRSPRTTAGSCVFWGPTPAAFKRTVRSPMGSSRNSFMN